MYNRDSDAMESRVQVCTKAYSVDVRHSLCFQVLGSSTLTPWRAHRETQNNGAWGTHKDSKYLGLRRASVQVSGGWMQRSQASARRKERNQRETCEGHSEVDWRLEEPEERSGRELNECQSGRFHTGCVMQCISSRQ